MNYIMNELTIFIFKILIIIFIITTILIIIKLSNTEQNKIKIENLNKKYENLQKIFYSKILTKTEKNKKKQKITTKNEKNIIKNNLFILEFNAGLYADEIKSIKDIISTIIQIAKETDEVLIILTSSGGLVNNYGYAASQIKRFAENNITLTISIDLIAASGGYLIASTAKNIIASEFAIIGSIGVLGQIPNFNKLLSKNNIKIEQHISGEYKKTLTIFGKNEEKGREKFIEIIKNTHELFKNYIKKNRPILPINEISTGEYWYGIDAIKLKLIDEIKTSDEYIMEKLKTNNVYMIKTIKTQDFKTILKDKIKEKILNIMKL